jgi:hypothetical protein
MLALSACARHAPDEAPTDAASGGIGGDAGLAPAPWLRSSSPALGATDVYPAPLSAESGEEFAIELTFSEPMRLAGELSLRGDDHAREVAELRWSSGETHLTLLFRPDFEHPRALAEHTEYSLDLSPLAGAAGGHLTPDVGLIGRALVFSTGRYDGLLNHSCGHTFFGPFASVAASQSADASASDVTTTHTQYSVTLPAREGGYGGWLRANFPSEGPYRLYFDAETQVALSDASEEEPQAVALSPTPPACPGISREVSLTPVAGRDLFLLLGPESLQRRRIIVELVPLE